MFSLFLFFQFFFWRTVAAVSFLSFGCPVFVHWLFLVFCFFVYLLISCFLSGQLCSSFFFFFFFFSGFLSFCRVRSKPGQGARCRPARSPFRPTSRFVFVFLFFFFPAMTRLLPHSKRSEYGALKYTYPWAFETLCLGPWGHETIVGSCQDPFRFVSERDWPLWLVISQISWGS